MRLFSRVSGPREEGFDNAIERLGSRGGRHSRAVGVGGGSWHYLRYYLTLLIKGLFSLTGYFSNFTACMITAILQKVMSKTGKLSGSAKRVWYPSPSRIHAQHMKVFFKKILIIPHPLKPSVPRIPLLIRFVN